MLGAKINFNQYDTIFKYNNNQYLLKHSYSYTLTQNDIDNGTDSSWSKTIIYSKDSSDEYIKLVDSKLYNVSTCKTIDIFQGKLITTSFSGANNSNLIGTPYQFYDINDLTFSNWYGQNDPFAFDGTTYNKTTGYTKVGIGTTETEAFSDDNLFEIELKSILLNDNILYNNTIGNKICLIETNPDKSVRINFGDGNVAIDGIDSPLESIYVQYISCIGVEANSIGVNGNTIKAQNKFYASMNGNIIDVTDNISFTLTTDITGGEDFESLDSLKINAPVEYSAASRLVTLPDYQRFLKGLSSPISVKNAICWGEESVENDTKELKKYMQNIIAYVITGSFYTVDNSSYTPINIYDGTSNVTTIYGSDFDNHIADYLYMLMDFSNFAAEQENASSLNSWVQNAIIIRTMMDKKSFMNVKEYSLPPVVQYFDVVGTVKVNKLTNLINFKEKLENTIYTWLNTNCDFNTEIYLSDFNKQFLADTHVKNCDLDIKVSNWIKSDIITYYFDSTNATITGETDSSYNELNLTLADLAGNDLTIEELENKILTLTMNVTTYTAGPPSTSTKIVEMKPTAIELTSNNHILITFPSDILVLSGNTFSQVLNSINISFALNSDYFNNSNLYTNLYSDSNNYNLTNTQIQNVITDIANWISSINTNYDITNRPIPLPYEINYVNNTSNTSIDTYIESIMRRGNEPEVNLNSQLTEKSFWFYFIKEIIIKQYYNSDIINNWTYIQNLILDIYPLVKPIFINNILDNNHNIVNFSISNEIPVVKLNITYDYI